MARIRTALENDIDSEFTGDKLALMAFAVNAEKQRKVIEELHLNQTNILYLKEVYHLMKIYDWIHTTGVDSSVQNINTFLQHSFQSPGLNEIAQRLKQQKNDLLQQHTDTVVKRKQITQNIFNKVKPSLTRQDYDALENKNVIDIILILAFSTISLKGQRFPLKSYASSRNTGMF